MVTSDGVQVLYIMRCSVIRYSVAAIPVVEVCACHALMWCLLVSLCPDIAAVGVEESK